MAMVTYTLENLPPTNIEVRDRGIATKNGDIDCSDIPDLSALKLRPKPLVDRSMYRPVKVTLTCRLDADIVAWLKQGGKGYQTRLNAILRQAMTHAQEI
ncbi:MAG: BrnA antitoxin family protein [Treponema sp.]|jgi:uncharacterized protein (DUF4415 family)|nr:BrnA antitoxin family protein [Treponema sp.]